MLTHGALQFTWNKKEKNITAKRTSIHRLPLR